MIQIGLVGCGNIGSALAEALQSKFSETVRLKYISDRHPHQILKLRKQFKSLRLKTVSVTDLVKKSDFVIEAASVNASEQLVPLVLKANKQILVMSVGGLVKIKRLDQLLKRSKGRVFIPSGGIAGIDAVLAAKVGGIQSVQITTRKPLKSLKQAPFFLGLGFLGKKMKRPKLIFQGNALSAIKNFPENVNVAATLSLAGIGPKKTKVKIFTSDSYRFNVHEIEIRGRYGKIMTQVTNVPSPRNPKTSALAIGSAIATVEKIFSPIKIGT